MGALESGYRDTFHSFFDKIFVEGDFMDNYNDAQRSFDLLEKNASKNSPYDIGISEATSIITSLGNAGIGYFSCLKGVDGLLKNGSSRLDILEMCMNLLEDGNISDNPATEEGFKYACRTLIENDLSDSIRNIAITELTNGRL